MKDLNERNKKTNESVNFIIGHGRNKWNVFCSIECVNETDTDTDNFQHRKPLPPN